MTVRRFAIIFALGLFICSVQCVDAHTRIAVLADTDMALDDIRTLVMLLNSETADIRLIVSSDGAVSPRVGCRNIKQLLKCFDRDGIKVGVGRDLNKPAPPWRPLSENPNWPDSRPLPDPPAPAMPAAKAIVNTLNSADGESIYLCLGPLTNLADALRADPGIKEKISRVIFFGGSPGGREPGWNYKYDAESAEFVFRSGMTIYSVHIPEKKLLPFDAVLYSRIQAMDTPAANIVAAVHEPPAVRKLLFEGHFRMWDEMTVVYMNYPYLFDFEPTEISEVMTLSDFRSDKIREAYLKLLGHGADFHLDTREAVVLKAFPDEPSMFREDIGPYVKKIIERYGFEEWKACFLTNELHRHLGIYSLIGAKMGIRAREILEAPFDTLEVLSLAGNKPPLSCMNDGLQAATGASLGRGTIEISRDESKPGAVFFYKDRALYLKIKKEIVEKIKSDIKAALEKYGGLNPSYFAHIRKLSVDYWYELDRRKIFEETSEKDRKQGGW